MSEHFSPGRLVPHAGTYRRELPVSVERLYENAIDWEHLPYLHRDSFAQVECIQAGAWGFAARVWPKPYDRRRSFIIELRLDRELRRWITHTLDGPGRGTEIWTHAFPLFERQTLVVVDFFVPGVDEARRSEIGRFYTDLYARLYDEDVRMMSERQMRVDNASARSLDDRPAVLLGTLTDVRLQLPIRVDVGGQKFCIVESEGELVAFSTTCPHMLGPLAESEVRDGIVECPWHGYRYDIRTRRCITGANLTLANAPRVTIDTNSSVILDFAKP